MTGDGETTLQCHSREGGNPYLSCIYNEFYIDKLRMGMIDYTSRFERALSETRDSVFRPESESLHLRGEKHAGSH